MDQENEFDYLNTGFRKEKNRPVSPINRKEIEFALDKYNSKNETEKKQDHSDWTNEYLKKMSDFYFENRNNFNSEKFALCLFFTPSKIHHLVLNFLKNKIQVGFVEMKNTALCLYNERKILSFPGLELVQGRSGDVYFYNGEPIFN